MANLSYRLKKTKGDSATVYVRFRNGREIDLEASTNIFVDVKHWSATKQCIKTVADSDYYRNNINSQLIKLEETIRTQYIEDNHNGLQITNKWLKDVITVFHNKPTEKNNDIEIYLTAFADFFTESSKSRNNIRKGKPLNKRTIQDFNNTSNKLKAYEKLLGRKIKLTEVDFVFYDNFIIHLRNIEHLNDNTIGGVIDNLKSFLRRAELYGYKVNQAFKDKNFYSPYNKTENTYLDKLELQKISNYNFEIDSYLDNARDWLIIGAWTGLRVSDLLNLTKADITNECIDNTNMKTDIPVAIPLHNQVKEILSKRNGDFPRNISEQKFNEYIKEVAEKVGISELIYGGKEMPIIDEKGNTLYRKVWGTYPKHELITSHICRRSFATNLYGKIDSLTIMKITGHSTEKQFLQYIKITPREHANRIKELWEKEYLKEQEEELQLLNK